MGAEATQVTVHFEFNLLPTISFLFTFFSRKVQRNASVEVQIANYQNGLILHHVLG